MRIKKLILLSICTIGCLSGFAQVLTAEQNRQIGECELRLGELESAIEMAKGDYDDAVRELKAGLFCSDCKRPKSEIERETKASFQKHIAEGGPSRKVVEATQEAYTQAYNKYKSKVDGYKTRLESQKQQCERLRNNFKEQAQRQKEKEEQDKINASRKAESEAANKAQQAKDEAARKKREQENLEAENARRRAAHAAELERQKQENIQALRSNISGTMSSLNSESRENADRQVQKLAKDKDWIENNNLGTNQQLQQQQNARRQAQNRINDLNSQGDDLYNSLQRQTSNTSQQLQDRSRSLARNAAERYEQAKSWLSDWRVKANEACNGNCFINPLKPIRYTAKELKNITKDYLRLVTWPVNAPRELFKINSDLLEGVTNSLEDGQKMEEVLNQYQRSFREMLPFGSTAERLNGYGASKQ